MKHHALFGRIVTYLSEGVPCKRCISDVSDKTFEQPGTIQLDGCVSLDKAKIVEMKDDLPKYKFGDVVRTPYGMSVVISVVYSAGKPVYITLAPGDRPRQTGDVSMSRYPAELQPTDEQRALLRRAYSIGANVKDAENTYVHFTLKPEVKYGGMTFKSSSTFCMYPTNLDKFRNGYGNMLCHRRGDYLIPRILIDKITYVKKTVDEKLIRKANSFVMKVDFANGKKGKSYVMKDIEPSRVYVTDDDGNTREIPYPFIARAITQQFPKVEVNKDKLFEHAKEFTKRVENEPGLCAFCFVNGQNTYDRIMAACHAGFSRWQKTDVDAILLYIQKWKDAFGYKLYVDYILNESPYKEMFILPDNPQDVWEHGSVVLNVNYPGNMLVGAAVALREGNEFPRFTKAFAKLVKAGASKHAAYIISRGFNESLQHVGVDNAHKVFHPDLNINGLARFIVKGYPDEVRAQSPYYIKQSYSGIARHVAEMSAPHYAHFISEVIVGEPAQRRFGEEKAATPLEKLLKLCEKFDQLVKEVK